MLPSARDSAGAAIGSNEQSSTWRLSSPARVSGAVAAAAISRIATMSHSPSRPSNGRATYVGAGPEALPWHAL
jgi:hypothetical protein